VIAHSLKRKEEEEEAGLKRQALHLMPLGIKKLYLVE
jgi:hypothetical protein